MEEKLVWITVMDSLVATCSRVKLSNQLFHGGGQLEEEEEGLEVEGIGGRTIRGYGCGSCGVRGDRIGACGGCQFTRS